jgi:hypothetical protein
MRGCSCRRGAEHVRAAGCEQEARAVAKKNRERDAKRPEGYAASEVDA